MSIEYKQGDMFSEDVQAYINPTNCFGVSGAGLAKEFRSRFPGNYDIYKDKCSSGEFIPGTVLVTGTQPEKLVVNFATKNHWKNPSTTNYIEIGLIDLKKAIINLKIESIAIPALGCGLGGLEWNEVRQLIEAELGDLENVKILVFEPN